MNQFAHYILDEFPKIKVKFQNNIQNKEDYYLFEKEWLDCYNYKKHFSFVFDTTNVGMIHIKYVYKLTKFIHNLKKKNIIIQLNLIFYNIVLSLLIIGILNIY